MEFLGRIEIFLERLLGRFAGSSRQRSVQPVEIGRHLVKIMLADRRVSTVDVYVPNQYRVYLSEKDWEKLEPLRRTITDDIRAYLSNRASRQGVKFAAPVQIEFEIEHGMQAGTLRGEALFKETVAEPCKTQGWGGCSPSNSTNGTQVYTLPEVAESDSRASGGLAELVVLDGPDRGGKWALGTKPVLLGRGLDQDVQLRDPGVSRHHAVIRLVQGRYWIEDSDSKNGIGVNSSLIKETVLADGDVIQVGNNRLQFRMVNQNG